MKILLSRPNCETYPNIKFHENASSGIRVFPFGQTEGQTDMKITVAFRKSAAELKKCEGNASILRMWRLIHCCEARLNCYTVTNLFELVTYVCLFMVDIYGDKNLDFAQNMDTVKHCT